MAEGRGDGGGAATLTEIELKRKISILFGLREALIRTLSPFSFGTLFGCVIEEVIWYRFEKEPLHCCCCCCFLTFVLYSSFIKNIVQETFKYLYVLINQHYAE